MRAVGPECTCAFKSRLTAHSQLFVGAFKTPIMSIQRAFSWVAFRKGAPLNAWVITHKNAQPPTGASPMPALTRGPHHRDPRGSEPATRLLTSYMGTIQSKPGSRGLGPHRLFARLRRDLELLDHRRKKLVDTVIRCLGHLILAELRHRVLS